MRLYIEIEIPEGKNPLILSRLRWVLKCLAPAVGMFASSIEEGKPYASPLFDQNENVCGEWGVKL